MWVEATPRIRRGIASSSYLLPIIFTQFKFYPPSHVKVL